MGAKEFISRISKQPRVDPVFLIVSLLLLVIGLVMLFSAGFAKALFEQGNSYYYITKQLVFAVLGLIAMFIVSFIPHSFYKMPIVVHTFYWVKMCIRDRVNTAAVIHINKRFSQLDINGSRKLHFGFFCLREFFL